MLFLYFRYFLWCLLGLMIKCDLQTPSQAFAISGVAKATMAQPGPSGSAGVKWTWVFRAFARQKFYSSSPMWPHFSPSHWILKNCVCVYIIYIYAHRHPYTYVYNSRSLSLRTCKISSGLPAAADIWPVVSVQPDRLWIQLLRNETVQQCYNLLQQILLAPVVGSPAVHLHPVVSLTRSPNMQAQ